MKNIKLALLTWLSGAVLSSTAGAAVIFSDVADAIVGLSVNPAPVLPVDGGGSVSNVGDASMAVGNTGIYNNFGTLNTIVLPFLLPSLGATANPFTSASFSITQDGSINTFSSINIDLYGLGVRATSTIVGSDFYAGAGDSTDATLLVQNFIQSDSGSPNTTGTIYTSSAVPITDYLNAAYASGAGAGQYAFIRLNVNSLPGDFFKTIGFLSGDAGTGAPSLTFTAVPEPSLFVLAVPGLVALLGIRRRFTA